MDDGDNIVELRPTKTRKKCGPMSPEAKAKWRASVAKSNNKPSDGHPPSGAGWGGSAKGASASPPMSADHPSHVGNLPPHVRAIKRMAREERLDALKDNLLELALDPEQPGQVRVGATNAYLDREEGKPVQRNLNADTTAEEMFGALMEVSRERDVG